MNVGGVETGTVDLAKYLVAHGHKSVVVSHGGDLVEVLESQGTKHYTLPVHKKNIFTMVRCINKLVAIIHKEKIDIVRVFSNLKGETNGRGEHGRMDGMEMIGKLCDGL